MLIFSGAPDGATKCLKQLIPCYVSPRSGVKKLEILGFRRGERRGRREEEGGEGEKGGGEGRRRREGEQKEGGRGEKGRGEEEGLYD